MPKTPTQDTSNYRNIGQFHWRDENLIAPGIKAVKPNREMLTPGGYAHKSISSKDETVKVIIYDRDYVIEQLYALLEGIGVYQNGKTDEVLRDSLLNDLDNIGPKRNLMDKLSKLRSIAKQISETTGSSVEDAYQMLLNQSPDLKEMASKLDGASTPAPSTTTTTQDSKNGKQEKQKVTA